MHSQEVFFLPTQYLMPPEMPQVPPMRRSLWHKAWQATWRSFCFPC